MSDDSLTKAPALLAPIARIYTRRVETYGATPKGVLWTSGDAQVLRFEILAKLFDGVTGPVSVNDLGCGYGAFFDFLIQHGFVKIMRYWGYDISEEMIETCKDRIKDPRADFRHSLVATQMADYSFASGTFNFKGKHNDAVWEDYIKSSLKHLWRASKSGMAFNLLSTENAEPEGGLYYAEPEAYMDFCQTEITANAELHREGVKDWTIFLRRA